MSRTISIVLGALSVFGLLQVGLAQAQTKIKVSSVQNFGAIVAYIANDKGYFKQEGLDVEIVYLNAAADAMALLAQGDFQVVEGGVSVGFFNALARGLPLVMTSDRVSTPIHHMLLAGSQNKGKITDVGDLRGKNIGTNSISAVTTYEIGKVLAASGMTLKDVEIKTLSFAQMIPALKNGALDATMEIPPFAAAIEDDGIGYAVADADDVIKPSPATIAATFINTDWAAKNKEAMRGFFVAYLRATREYCTAYHHGANRAEVMQIALKNGLDHSIDSIERNPWTGRSMDGSVHMESVLDQQAWYVTNGLLAKPQTADRIYTAEYIDYANKKLGPIPPVNPESKLPGCR
jgi:NitT/TauT family transport system substrate-binding protein